MPLQRLCQVLARIIKALLLGSAWPVTNTPVASSARHQVKPCQQTARTRRQTCSQTRPSRKPGDRPCGMETPAGDHSTTTTIVV